MHARVITKSEPSFLVCFGLKSHARKKKSSLFVSLLSRFFFLLFETLGCLNDDVRDQKTNGGREGFFFVVVGCGREVRRYLFHSYLAEIEWD